MKTYQESWQARKNHNEANAWSIRSHIGYCMTNITQLLSRIESGDPEAAEALMPFVYDELRRLAKLRLSSEQPGQTLQATALVHEAYLRLVGEKPNSDTEEKWNGRGHFLALPRKLCGGILVENARRKNAAKRGGQRAKVTLDEGDAVLNTNDDLLALDEAPWSNLKNTMHWLLSSSNSATSPDSPCPKPPRRWACPCGPPNAIGPTPNLGCTPAWLKIDSTSEDVRQAIKNVRATQSLQLRWSNLSEDALALGVYHYRWPAGCCLIV